MVILGVCVAPMYLVGHWHTRALLYLGGVAITAVVALYFTWYRNLPESKV